MALASNVLKILTAVMASSVMVPRRAMMVTANLAPTLVAKASSAMRLVTLAIRFLPATLTAIAALPMLTAAEENAEDHDAGRLASNVSFRRTLGCVFVKEICLNCNAYVYFRVGSFFLD